MSDAKLTHLDDTGAANMVDCLSQGANRAHRRSIRPCAHEP